MSSRISRLASSLTFHAQKMHYGFSTSTATPIQTLMQIIDKKVINHDSYIYRMKFIEQVIPISIGQHLAISQVIKTYHCAEGEEVTRRYTPITPCGQHVVIISCRKSSSC